MSEEKEEQSTDNEQRPKEQTWNESSAGENIIATDEQPLNVKPLNDLNDSNENMEVHHHSHSHGKKNWKSYFWEFLMLFLAVFCGFLAEYQLEHMIEHNREKQFMQSMVNDLMADAATLNEGFPYKEGRIKAIDSLFDYFAVHKNKSRIPVYVHNLMRRTSWDRSYNRNNITMSQLKNSGAMRLIRKRNVSDSILHYDFSWEQADNFYKETYWLGARDINDYIKKIIADYSLLSYYKANETTAARLGDSLHTMIEVNTTFLLEYLNHLHKLKATIRQDKTYYEGIKAKAERLIELIKKEYHLE